MEKKIAKKHITPHLHKKLKKDPKEFVEALNAFYTDRARVDFIKRTFKEMSKDDGKLIANNLPKIIGCFRSCDEVLAILDQCGKIVGIMK